MNNLILYVGDRLVDLSPEVVATTVYGYDFTEPTVRNVDYTSSFKAPFTENNIVTFGFSNDLHSNTVKPYRYLSCRYFLNGVPAIREGLLMVQRSDGYFSLNIYNNEKQVFDFIENKKLYELGYLTDGPYNNSLIDSWRLSTSGIVSPYLDWGVATLASILPDYYLPTWFYYELVMKSLEFTGMILEGDIFTADDFINLVVPFSLDDWIYPEVFNDGWKFYAKNSGNQVISSSTPIAATTVIYEGDRNLYNAPSNFIMPTVGATGTYVTMNFKGSIRYTSTGSPGDSFYFRIILYRSAGEITLVEQLETMVAPGGGGEFTLESTVNLQDGDTIYLKLFTNVGTPTVTITDVTFQGKNTGRVHDNWVFFNYLLPDITMAEIVNDFTNRFGIIYRQVGNRLICKTLQEVIGNKQNAIDWTDKRDKRTDLIDFEPNYAKLNAFSYTSSIENDEDFGTGYLEIDNDTLEEEDTLFESIFEDSETNLILFVNTGRIPVYDTLQPSFSWDQVNNSGGFVQLQFNSVDRTEDFPVGSTIKFSSTGGLYLDVYADVTASSFSTNTLLTLSTTHIGAAGSGGTANIVDRAAFADSPGLKLMTLRDRESGEQTVSFGGAFRSDYRVAYFHDAAFERSCNGQYFVDNYYSNLSTALQKYKALTRNYNLSQVDLNNYNNHKIIYDSGDYFLVKKIPNFVNGFVSKVEQLLIYPAGNEIELEILVYPGTGEGVYTGFAPSVMIESRLEPDTGEGIYTGFEPTVYIGPPS